MSQSTIKELITADTKRSVSFHVWESILNFKFSQSLFSYFRETCPIPSFNDSSPDVSDLQHLNWPHPWNTLWLGKTTVHGGESRARRLTRKNRQKLHISQSLFLLETWNSATAGLGWHRDVEMMLNLIRCSQLRVCPVFLNLKRSCSNSKVLTMLYNRQACCFLSPLVFCFKEMSQNIFSGSVSAEGNWGKTQADTWGRQEPPTHKPPVSVVHSCSSIWCSLPPSLENLLEQVF